MKARDIEKRLQEKLPLLTNKFTREVTIIGIVPTGSVATATTSAPHGLSAGVKVLVAGAFAPVSIATITRAGTIATVVTNQDHDLTEGFFPTVSMSGSTQVEFNGTFPLLTVPNRRTYTIQVLDAGPTNATGSPKLDDPGIPFAYSGLQTVVSTPTSTTFTYNLPSALTIPAVGINIRAILGVRIHSAISYERAQAVFESQDIKVAPNATAALFVILGSVVANKDRTSLNDGVSSAGVSGDNRQRIFQGASIVVFQKVTDKTSGADAMDEMQDIAKHIISVLAGWSPGDEWAVQSGNKLRFVEHDMINYDTAIYAHKIDFQLAGDISTEDLMITPTNVAFRDIQYSFTTDQGNQVISATVNLDAVPLGA